MATFGTRLRAFTRATALGRARRTLAAEVSRAPVSVPFPLAGHSPVQVSVPAYVMDPDPKAFERAVEAGQYHIGDIVWPSAAAFAELITEPGWAATAESLNVGLSGKRVLELGSGLGLAGLALYKGGGAKSVVLSDNEMSVLTLAADSISVNGFNDGVRTMVVDWNNKDSWPCPQDFDAVIATDVLYHGSNHAQLLSLFNHLLGGNRFALVLEPVHDERIKGTDGGDFVEGAEKAGLSVTAAALPGSRPMEFLKLWRE